MSLLIHNATVITRNEVIHNAWVLCDGGTIVSIGTGDVPTADTSLDAQGKTLLPGFIDIHVHGAVGCDVMDANVADLQKMAAFFAQHGVTSFLPTTLTASHENILSALKAIRDAMDSDYTGANILGAHLEGPYLNPAKCGAQDIEHIRRANEAEVQELLDLDVIKQVSVAPEYDENHAFITQCREREITVSAAHTNATYDEMQKGIELGIRHATHTYNAMPSLHHRNTGGMAALMLDNRVRCELIADTVHVAPPMMDLLYRLKGHNGVILISDAMRAAGMPEGEFTLGNHAVTVANGKATLADGTLAGSILTMDVALKNFMNATNQTIETIWQVSSYNAAQAIGAPNKGAVEEGYDADFVLIDDTVTVHTTIIGGQIVYERQLINH